MMETCAGSRSGCHRIGSRSDPALCREAGPARVFAKRRPPDVAVSDVGISAPKKVLDRIATRGDLLQLYSEELYPSSTSARNT